MVLLQSAAVQPLVVPPVPYNPSKDQALKQEVCKGGCSMCVALLVGFKQCVGEVGEEMDIIMGGVNKEAEKDREAWSKGCRTN